jgi:hypothetical protein
MSPSCTQNDADTVDLITRIRNTQKYERHTTYTTHAIFTEALHQTPPSIHECIRTSDDVSMLALRAGYLTEQQGNDIVEKGTPRRLILNIAATIERTCLSHPHATWTERNKTPDRQQLNDDKLHRLRHNKHDYLGVTICTDDTDNTKTTTWVKTRADTLARKWGWTLWATGAPPQKRPKRKPIVTTFKPPAKEPFLPRKRGRTQITLASHIPLPGLMHDIFRTPTEDDIITAIAFRSNPPQARALRSLRQGNTSHPA